ncbi:N-(5'-phosphoribosyl)anthranilate isomerase [Candidatus Tenderia electrophaga]|jgi:phosphoribosylanthranilate isomerase|uniref:N-(5'-phosphoribosyl)anthranilate isomerase n=1 Tax=Candidatus Tenderia electrophaga TaxID=1748243 RepID=A0A0S2TFW9_9GAMM|nr:N-(5'-phosphoribosyl)anthranilate isomerase [Candidatus Tenderia electrophaga]
MRTRIKICGITRPEDGRAAARLGADAIGLVFYANSPRALTPAQAEAVTAALPPFVTTVGLFVDPSPDEVETVLARVPLDMIQFHGDETPEFCARFDRPWLKAVRMRETVDLQAEMERYRRARGLLLDAYQPDVPGGTGECFDWRRVPPQLAHSIVLAGGLNATNVAAAIQQVRPYAVDVSGGVESAKGIKDAAKMAAFIGEVRRVESEPT